MTNFEADVRDRPTQEILDVVRAELKRRNKAVKDGRCPYCEIDLKTHTCRWTNSQHENFHETDLAL